MSMLKRTMSTAAALKDAGKVVCIGRNYAEHIAELRNAKPKQPFFFLKPPSSILPPSSGPCLRPRGTSLHYEVELALIMKQTLRDARFASEAEALATIKGYAVAIDMTARNVQDEAKRKGLPWTSAKGFDTFLPVSRVMTPEEVGDPHDAELWLDVNGETRQKGWTGLMIYRIPRILSDISRVMTLREGDVVLTGTPAGVGPVVPGDVMTAGLRVGGREVEGGRIEVKVEESASSYEFAET